MRNWEGKWRGSISHNHIRTHKHWSEVEPTTSNILRLASLLLLSLFYDITWQSNIISCLKIDTSIEISMMAGLKVNGIDQGWHNLWASTGASGISGALSWLSILFRPCCWLYYVQFCYIILLSYLLSKIFILTFTLVIFVKFRLENFILLFILFLISAW
jgi:hypothetical protein